MMIDLSEALENEWYIVRYSGEIPEIAYNSSIYFLTRAQDGPQARLDEAQIKLLQDAAVARFAEIVLRDLQHVNYSEPTGKPIRRGVVRSIANYRRFCVFCERQQLGGVAVERVRNQAAEALLIFLTTELEQLQSGKRLSVINCTYKELQDYAELLGVGLQGRYQSLEQHCPASSA